MSQSKPHSEREELQEAISYLVERAPQTTTEKFATNALPLLMQANNLISDLFEQFEAQGRRLDAVRLERDGLENQRDVAYRQRDEACNEFVNLHGLLDEAESLLRKSGGNPGRTAHWHDLHEKWLRRYRAVSGRESTAGNDGSVPGTPGLDGCAERQSRPATSRSETAPTPSSDFPPVTVLSRRRLAQMVSDAPANRLLWLAREKDAWQELERRNREAQS